MISPWITIANLLATDMMIEVVSGMLRGEYKGQTQKNMGRYYSAMSKEKKALCELKFQSFIKRKFMEEFSQK